MTCIVFKYEPNTVLSDLISTMEEGEKKYWGCDWLGQSIARTSRTSISRHFSNLCSFYSSAILFDSSQRARFLSASFDWSIDTNMNIFCLSSIFQHIFIIARDLQRHVRATTCGGWLALIDHYCLASPSLEAIQGETTNGPLTINFFPPCKSLDRKIMSILRVNITIV